MTRSLVTIQKVKEILPIPNADMIELAKIEGWQCVVKKGEFKVNDLCVFYEIDSLLPLEEQYSFLKKSCYKKNSLMEGYRIKTIKLKGTLSQGLALPLSILEGRKFPNDERENPIYDFKEGMVVTEMLGVQKYEMEIPAQISGLVKGNFPTYIVPKTDEMRVQVLQHLLDKYRGTLCFLTEKLDGSSFTCYFDGENFGICSRNLELKETPDNALWKIARQLEIEEKLRAFGSPLALQGELYGNGIGGNPLKLKEGQKLAFFNAFDVKGQFYLNFWDFKQLMFALKLETVPILQTSHIMLEKVEDYIEMAKGKSVLNSAKNREGIVIRPLIEITDDSIPELSDNRGRISFKAINNDYLLESEE